MSSEDAPDQINSMESIINSIDILAFVRSAVASGNNTHAIFGAVQAAFVLAEEDGLTMSEHDALELGNRFIREGAVEIDVTNQEHVMAWLGYAHRSFWQVKALEDPREDWDDALNRIIGGGVADGLGFEQIHLLVLEYFHEYLKRLENIETPERAGSYLYNLVNNLVSAQYPNLHQRYEDILLFMQYISIRLIMLIRELDLPRDDMDISPILDVFAERYADNLGPILLHHSDEIIQKFGFVLKPDERPQTPKDVLSLFTDNFNLNRILKSLPEPESLN